MNFKKIQKHLPTDQKFGSPMGTYERSALVREAHVRQSNHLKSLKERGLTVKKFIENWVREGKAMEDLSNFPQVDLFWDVPDEDIDRLFRKIKPSSNFMFLYFREKFNLLPLKTKRERNHIFFQHGTAREVGLLRDLIPIAVRAVIPSCNWDSGYCFYLLAALCGIKVSLKPELEGERVEQFLNLFDNEANVSDICIHFDSAGNIQFGSGSKTDPLKIHNLSFESKMFELVKKYKLSIKYRNGIYSYHEPLELKIMELYQELSIIDFKKSDTGKKMLERGDPSFRIDDHWMRCKKDSLILSIFKGEMNENLSKGRHHKKFKMEKNTEREEDFAYRVINERLCRVKGGSVSSNITIPILKGAEIMIRHGILNCAELSCLMPCSSGYKLIRTDDGYIINSNRIDYYASIASTENVLHGLGINYDQILNNYCYVKIGMICYLGVPLGSGSIEKSDFDKYVTNINDPISRVPGIFEPLGLKNGSFSHGSLDSGDNQILHSIEYHHHCQIRCSEANRILSELGGFYHENPTVRQRRQYKAARQFLCGKRFKFDMPVYLFQKLKKFVDLWHEKSDLKETRAAKKISFEYESQTKEIIKEESELKLSWQEKNPFTDQIVLSVEDIKPKTKKHRKMKEKVLLYSEVTGGIRKKGRSIAKEEVDDETIINVVVKNPSVDEETYSKAMDEAEKGLERYRNGEVETRVKKLIKRECVDSRYSTEWKSVKNSKYGKVNLRKATLFSKNLSSENPFSPLAIEEIESEVRFFSEKPGYEDLKNHIANKEFSLNVRNMSAYQGKKKKEKDFDNSSKNLSEQIVPILCDVVIGQERPRLPMRIYKRISCIIKGMLSGQDPYDYMIKYWDRYFKFIKRCKPNELDILNYDCFD
jgi:hypothetical protein